MRMRIALTLIPTSFLSLCLPSPASAQLPDSLAPALTLPVGDFNFWIGGWAVNLRTLQADASWQDTYTGRAEVYSVLGGKAILELWDEQTLKGFSIRYRDPIRDVWSLWLNWPAPNRSGTSGLEGDFRHGRGEFFTTFLNADSTEVIARYTFSDITPTSLRWDDAYSSDGGETWTPRWIMEFTRMAVEPRFGGDGGPAHTFDTGDRCDLPAFDRYEFLSGPWVGTANERGRDRPVAVTGYQILDGCALLLFAGRTGRPETANRFAHLTWNTSREAYELLSLTGDSASTARQMSGEIHDTGFTFYDGDDPASRVWRVRIERGADDVVHWVEEIRESDGWVMQWQATVERFVPGRS
jgi:hypothetical protein